MRISGFVIYSSVIVLAVALVSARASRAGAVQTAFPMHHGVNVAGPFVRIEPPQAGSPFTAPVFWGMERFPNWYTGSNLRKLGYDFVRLPVNPAVFLENPPEVRAQLLHRLDAAIHEFVGAGLAVIVDLHFWGTNDNTWTNTQVTADPNGSAFAQYRAVVREMTANLKQFPRNAVALEPLNEPTRANCPSWLQEQRLLLSDIRAKQPDLPVVITGCQGELPELIKLTPNDIEMNDPNLIYTFHFYLPFVFTHQGGYKSFLQVDDLPYPSSPGNVNETLAKTNANIDAAGLSPADEVFVRGEAVKYIKLYYQQRANRDFIKQQIGMVATWADSNHIPRSRLLMGEFAAINWRKSDTPEYHASRLRWDDDVQSVADQFKIACAYWVLPYPKGPVFH